MPTPHISAQAGDIAPTVLMPGDPLRAKKIVQTFLDDCTLFNEVRGMLGYTGNYKGKRVSVMGSGMGMPSIGVYSYELFTEYGVGSIIRVGSAGAYCPQLKLFDVVLASSAWSESSYAHTMSGQKSSAVQPCRKLNALLEESAKELSVPLRVGAIHSSDVFYRQFWQGVDPPYWHKIRDEQGCLAVEMEAFALFHNAQALGKKAACLLTISDSLVTQELTSSQQREESLMEMVKVALEAIE